MLGRPPVESRSRIAYVLQSTTVNEALPVTVREVVAMGRYASLGMVRRFGAADRTAVETAMDQAEVSDLATRQLAELSGGQRQRVFVAQGLAQDRDLLLLDEPLTGLDLVSMEIILGVVSRERAAGRTVIMTTHDLGDASQADHVILLAGRVVAEGPPGEVLDGGPSERCLRPPHRRHGRKGHGRRPGPPTKRPPTRASGQIKGWGGTKLMARGAQ